MINSAPSLITAMNAAKISVHCDYQCAFCFLKTFHDCFVLSVITAHVYNAHTWIILLFCLLPLTRLISGTAIGVKGAIVPLVFGTTPFFSRQIEAALSGVDEGLIEAAQSMGNSNWEIIFRVYWRESIASIARGTSITLINLVGLTAMAGAVGAGGLGNFAYIYGQQRNHMDDIYVTVVVLVLIVMLIQLIGNLIVKRNTH